MFFSLLAALTLSNASMEIRFADESRSYAITGIVNKIAAQTEFVHGAADGKGPHLFKLAFSYADPTGGVVFAYVSDRNDCRMRNIRKDGDTVRIDLQGYDLPGEPNAVDVCARVRLKPDDIGADWNIAVTCRSARWGLDTTTYPCLRGVVRPGEADVLLPHKGLGATLHRTFDGRARNTLCAWGEYECPSYYPMITAYMIGDAGLLVRPDDPDGRIKKLWANNLDCWYETPVENAGVAGRAASGPGYSVRTEAYVGDWWEAARIYRAWALGQKWCAKGPIARRADYPATMRVPSIWFCHHWWGAKGFIQFFERIKAEAPDVEVGVRWYDWSLPGFGVYPESFPPKVGVDEVGVALKSLGYTAMPYINARIWDSMLLSYRYAQKDMCLQPSGKPFTEQWGQVGAKGTRRRRDYGIMCPCCPDWQATLRDLALGTVDATGATAIYYDQLGCAVPRKCRNAAHGHPLGGGRWWTDGNREILRQARRVLNPKGIAITTEGTAEYYMDDCDGFLVSTSPMPDEVPFYTAVYSGYTIYFGTRSAPREPFERSFALMAREFVWGQVNGWSDDWRNKGVLKENCDAMILFARERQKRTDFMTYGHLLGELKTLDALPQVPYTVWTHHHQRKNPVTAQMNAVIGTWWCDCDSKRIALIAVNVSNVRRTIRFALPGRGKETAELTLEPFAVADHVINVVISKPREGRDLSRPAPSRPRPRQSAALPSWNGCFETASDVK